MQRVSRSLDIPSTMKTAHKKMGAIHSKRSKIKIIKSLAILMLSDLLPDISAHPPHISEMNRTPQTLPPLQVCIHLGVCPFIFFACVFVRTHSTHSCAHGGRGVMFAQRCLNGFCHHAVRSAQGVSQRVCVSLRRLYLATRFASKPSE